MRILLKPALRLGDAHLLHHVQRLGLGLVAFKSLVQLDTFLDLFADFLQRLQRSHGVLHHHGDLLSPDTHPFLLGLKLGQILVMVHNATAHNMAVCIRHSQKRLGKNTLAGAGLSHNGKGLSLIQVKRTLTDCLQGLPTHTEFNFHITCGQNDLFIHWKHPLTHDFWDQPHRRRHYPPDRT